jgi:hypothetical protein
MTEIEQLEHDLADLNARRDALRDEAQAVVRKLDALRTADTIERRLAAMSDAERAQLRQALGA